MARWRRGTAEESAAVPGQRAEPAVAPDEGRDDAPQAGEPQAGNQRTGAAATGAPETGAAHGREGTGPPSGPVAPTAERSPASRDRDQQPQQDPEPRGQQPHQDQQAQQPQQTQTKPPDHKVRRTRLSGTWAAVVGFGIVLLLLLIFILQNQNSVDVSYFGAHGHLALGVALLLAAVAGILLVALAGTARIMQLRATARKHRRADKKAVKAGQKAAKARR